MVTLDALAMNLVQYTEYSAQIDKPKWSKSRNVLVMDYERKAVIFRSSLSKFPPASSLFSGSQPPSELRPKIFPLILYKFAAASRAEALRIRIGSQSNSVQLCKFSASYCATVLSGVLRVACNANILSRNSIFIWTMWT